MRRSPALLIFILVLTGLSVWAVFTPKIDLPFLGQDGEGNPSRLVRDGFRLGLDLKGGTHLVMEADLSQLGPDQKPEDAVRGAMDIIQRRVDAYGVAEATVQRQPAGNRIMVQLPGVRNVDEALRLIGQTARLEFKEQEVDAQGNVVRDENGQPKWKPALARDTAGNEVTLTGKYLRPKTSVNLETQTTQPIVEFEWDNDGALLFKQITSRLIGQPLGIFLDDQLISAPTVRAVIEQRGIIEGLTLREAELLAIQLNAGALPVPLKIVQQEDVDAILGADSLRKSFIAGEIGLAAAVLFMILYYRLLGFVAALALGVYGVVLLALFKLAAITLSMGGIAGFILSLGMAVDANILIYERLREELRGGKTTLAAVAAGFSRAWPAIRDGNFTTLIACVVLLWFGSRFGASQVTGFAVTLFIGVVVSMFSAIVVTRAFLKLFLGTRLAKSAFLLRR